MNMLDKNFLQSFLRVNNASPNMSDAEVRVVLERAGWSASEVAAALTLLRSEPSPAPNDRSNIPFQSGMEFSSSQLSELLGVDVVIDPGRLQEHQGVMQGGAFSLRYVVTVFGTIVLATGLALGAGLFSAFMLEIGPFNT